MPSIPSMRLPPIAIMIALLHGCGDDGGGDPTSGPAGTSESGDSDPTGGSTSTGDPGSSGSTADAEASGSSGGSSGAETAASAPAAPSDLAVALLGAGGHLTWTDNSDDEDEFVIMRAQDDGAFEEIARTPFDSPTYHDEPLTSGSTYTYVVHAGNETGLSEPSNEAMLTVP